MWGRATGVLTWHISQPFDLVKVRLQTSEGVYKNTADCFKQIVKKDGIFGLYRGMATPLASITPIFAVSFWVSHLIWFNREREREEYGIDTLMLVLWSR